MMPFHLLKHSISRNGGKKAEYSAVMESSGYKSEPWPALSRKRIPGSAERDLRDTLQHSFFKREKYEEKHV